jgi:type IV secretion/conjugal transfer VirB4 family ATPase
MTIRRVSNYRTEPTDVGDLLPWAYLIAPSVIVNKNASFITTFRYRGPDLDSATQHELMSMAARQNNLLRRLGDGWFFHVDAQRIPCTSYPVGETFPDPITFLIDEERRAVFEAGVHYETEYYFTLGWLPPKASESAARAWFFTDPDGLRKQSEMRDRQTAEAWLATFQSERTRMLLQFEAILPECRALNDNELLTYLHDTISSKRHQVLAGNNAQELCRVLPDTPLIGGKEPRLGRHHLGVITVRQFPPNTYPGILDRLNRLDMAFRWVTRWVALDKLSADKEIKKVRREWFSGRKSLGVILKELITKEASALENPEAMANAADADAALQELAAEAVSYGYFTQTLIVLDTDPRRLEQKLSLVEREINGLGFVTVHEGRDGNALDAFLGAVPGNCQHNIRRPMISTLNLAHTMPSSAVWAGPKYCPSDLYPPQSPAHLYAVTGGTTPFRLSTFVGDVGHAIVVGPTGSGKSVLLNILEAQFRRYRDGQVYVFDKGGSSRVLTEAVGGTFYDLGGAGGPAFQPLAHVDSDSERAWAQDWIVDICIAEGLQMNPERKRAIWIALTAMATSPIAQRTMTAFNIMVQDNQIKAAMQPFTVDGAHGHLLDASHDDIALGSWLTFEMEELMQTKSVVMPVLSYLFHRLEQRFTGVPSLLVLDEAWLFLDNPAFAEKIREWLKVLRKANVAVIFATQSLADVGESKIVPTLIEACMTKIYLPNREARNEKIAQVYHQFGLNEKQLDILMTATPKSDYYLTSPVGNRLFSLGLGPLALAFCAATSKEAQRDAMALRREHSATQGFLAAYLTEIVERTRPETGDAPVQWALNFIRSLDDEPNAIAVV